ncbi:hypothetical protein FCIRC_1485 [Fusarium circinatum]|uniref:NACHT-NTPase and P-loop NTPases N-terminal domain-containing protein n=1 Tax=Fusarium circinatum TaxID=48490 RepID=A0A8H5UKV8_FUSCI|nr:hypothetical protein FCIRC_1485 [Fusarium circinatum]
MDSIIPIINTTTSTLELAEEAYGKMEESNQLKISFHQAGKQLETVKNTLNMIKDFIESGDSSGDDDAADTCIMTCRDNASFLQRAFADVARAPDHERLKQYRIYLNHQGKEYRVEVLVRAMMIDTCELAKHAGAERKVTRELKSMRWSIKKFDEAILKQDEEDEKMRGAVGVSHSGVGDLYQAKDDATQNNIKDNGTQYFGSSGGSWPQNNAPQ